MFTGIIEDLGEIKSSAHEKDGKILCITLPFYKDGLSIGQSISVNGVCLTMIKIDRDKCSFFASRTTLMTTNLDLLRQGDIVNLERPIRMNQWLSGHIVTGHIDTLAELQEIRGNRLRFSLPETIEHLLVDKGSVAIDGISLTIESLGDEYFWVTVIPHTMENTNMKYRRKGDRVNIEVDIISKYVWRFINTNQFQKSMINSKNLTREKLMSLGNF